MKKIILALIIITISCFFSCDLIETLSGNNTETYERINPIDAGSNNFIGVSLLTPAATITVGKPLFTWEASTLTGVTYRFQLSTDVDFTNPIIDEAGIISTECQAADFLPNKTTVYGRVSVSNADYTDIWSKPVTYTTDYILEVRSISIGYDLTTIVKEDDSLWIAGDNSHGFYGDGTTTTQDYPSKVADDVRIAEVCVPPGTDMETRLALFLLKNDGSLWGWGKNDRGQLGDGTTADKLTPTQVLADVKTFASSGIHTLAVKIDGTVWAWGDNSGGQLGDNSYAQRNSPEQVVGLSDVTAVSTSDSGSLAINTSGQLYTWGNTFNTSSSLVPELYSSSINFISMDSYPTGNIYFIDEQKTLYGAGNSVGDGTSFDRAAPTEIMQNVIQVSVKHSHYAAITSDNTLYKWGEGVLAPASFLTDIRLVENGVTFDMIVKTDGTLWVYGGGSATAAGDPSLNMSNTPVQVTTW